MTCWPKLAISLLALLPFASLYAQEDYYPGATQNTPSRSEYFSWINNTNEGASESQTFINLQFFRWLHDEYGMDLDIYAFDAGAIDGSKTYGSTDTETFRKQFPRGFGPLSEYALQTGTRFGIWGGPDGFGETDEQAQKRIDMMVGLVKDYNFTLFKMDAVCGQLRPGKYDFFDSMMTRIRQINPDFVLLNHRLNLGPGNRHSTTYLMGGAETYIDVHMVNDITASHHRVKALSRALPDGMTRLTEDHGVCLSSCLDYWQDDLVLQSFNRDLILAPEIYGNPWLLRDDEYADLAFIFNLHKDYRDILPAAIRLPESYGPEAVSRGDGKTMFLTLRNLTWEPIKYKVKLDDEIGLISNKKVKVRQYHPYILDLGYHTYGSEIEVEVLPFRSALVKVTTAPEKDAVAISGIPYKIVKDRTGSAVQVRLMGNAGCSYKVKIENASSFKSVELEGKKSSVLLSGRAYTVSFPGETLSEPWHRSLGYMQSTSVPEDAASIYYATCYAADNNALEAREAIRSGESKIPQVIAAREAFFKQETFVQRELWDKNLFDDDPNTAFSIYQKRGNLKIFEDASAFLLDFGEVTDIDCLELNSFDLFSISPYKKLEGATAYVSADLEEWQPVSFRTDVKTKIDLSGIGGIRYFRMDRSPLRLTEVYGYKDGCKLDRTAWRASNLFHTYDSKFNAKKAWKEDFVLDEIPSGAYLCVAINGVHGKNGAWAGFKIDGEYVGCPDRAPSFNSNPYEAAVRVTESNNTYYLPLTPDMKGKHIQAYVLGMFEDKADLKPEVWITNKEPYTENVTLKLF